MINPTETTITEARAIKDGLGRKTKKEVTAAYGRECLGRVSDPKGAGLSKSQMTYDIIRARFGRKAAEIVFA